MESKEQLVRDKILRIHHENKDLSHRSIAKTLGIANSTVSRVIKRFEERLTTDRKPRSEGKSIPYNTKNHNRVVGAFNRNPNASVRDVAKKLHLSRSFVQKAKTKAGLRTFKVQKAPNRDEKQNKSAKTRARKLYLNMLTKVECCIMDDETYVKADFKQIPGNLFFTAKDKFSVPEHVRTQKMSKFAKKFLVWQAICTCGKRSAPFVTQDTMNGQVYMKECLQKRLLPLLKAHNVPTIFWPDLASCHYSKDVLKWYADNKVNFVPKMFNPPNTPELRPIEKYWAIMKQHLLKQPKVVKTVEELKKVWVYMQKTVDSQVVHNLMAGVKAKVRAFAYGL